MVSTMEVPWGWLRKWSPIGFVIAGLGELIAVGLLILDSVTSMAIPELVISVFVLPSLFALFVVALPGFYPYVADASPRLALGGLLATAVGLISLTVTFLGSIVLELLGIAGFTEESALTVGFFVMLFALLLSMLLYGVASVRSKAPSRAVGLLLLFIVVEPATALLNDVVGVDVGLPVAFLTLGIAGLAFLAVGYFLGIESRSTVRAESSTDSIA